jgi:hypothetical protein
MELHYWGATAFLTLALSTDTHHSVHLRVRLLEAGVELEDIVHEGGLHTGQYSTG